MTEGQITDNDKLFAALSYIFWPLAIFVLFSETNKNRPFQRYHAVQALGVVVALVAVGMVFGCFFCIVNVFVSVIADSLSTCLSCIITPVGLIPLAIILWFAYRAFQGEQFEIPYLTEFMKGQSWL